MKEVFRQGVFETNSSTSHSTVIMTEDMYKKWEEENLYYYPSDRWYNPYESLPKDKQPKPGCLYTQDEVWEFYRLIGYECNLDEVDDYDEDDDEETLKDKYIREMGDFIGYESWSEDEYLETDNNYYTTPGGEKIVVSCKYGNDY